MSGGLKRAQHALERPLDRRVRALARLAPDRPRINYGHEPRRVAGMRRMVTIPLALRTVAGLDKAETKALVFVVQEWRRIEERRAGKSWPAIPDLATDHLTKHMKLRHTEAMKIVNRLRSMALLRLRPRQSAGLTGNGWDGALHGALTPSSEAVRLVDQYLNE